MTRIENTNEEIVWAETDLEHLIYYSAFCIGHISSTINIAILLDKPVLVPTWGKSKMLPDNFAKHGVAKYWHNLGDSLDLLTGDEARKKYISDNITITRPISTDLIESEMYTQD